MNKCILLFTVFLVGLPLASSSARPVSYPGGWTVMTMNDVEHNSLHIHYTPSPKYSIGWRHEYLRGTTAHADFVQINNLLKRWNQKGSQANLYLKTGIGVAYENDNTEPAAFTGMAADWEDRRFFTSYENRFFYADDIEKFAQHKARVGVAPYIGDFGDLHTWLMLEVEYNAANDDNFSATPLVRLFKGADMLEAGYNLDDGVLLNYIHRF